MSPNNNYAILLVDDDPRILQVFSVALAELGGFQVSTAVNGIEGLERFYENRPDCIILDVKMPEIDGYQMARAIRGDPSSAMTPMIILTAMIQEQDLFLGLASGVDQYIMKPVKPTELIAAIHQAMKLTKDERERRLRELADQQ